MIEEYSKSQHLWRDDREHLLIQEQLTRLEFRSSMRTGPKNPEDRLNLNDLSKSVNTHSENLYKRSLRKDEMFKIEHSEETIQDGDIMIAAITSCTNTSNPKGMIAAGLVAKI